ncbi:carbonic anhydrase family protein [Cupriavidus sp. DL-D2]|uniref:carbonic anhydrase n=1 Tax=Cupriavidus sp. DL-D2 TaxID=3144974 RepID=UPI0032150246
MFPFKTNPLAAFAGTLLLATALSATAAEHGTKWSYTGDQGAEHWGDLSPSFKACKDGKAQSPIDIQNARPGKLPPLAFHYPASAATVINNGHTIQVGPHAGGNAKLPSGVYQLLNFHFHTPSEMTVDGRAYPLSAHLVHRDAAGRLAVVGVLFEEGAENKALESIFQVMPEKGAAPVPLNETFSPADLLPEDLSYVAFDGSLTTPPCSEGVHWHVLKTPVQVSAAQIQAFRKLYPMNARPVQPMHDRVLTSNN